MEWLLGDPGTWKDLCWLAVNAVVGTIALLAPIALILGGVPVVLKLSLHPVERGALSGAERVGGAVMLAAGVAAAPWTLRGYGNLARLVLAPSEHSVLERRVAYLAQTRQESIDTGAAELRRIERDLHDGAQARLVAMGLTLDAAGRLIDTDPAAARSLLMEARDASAKALAELRDLVRGVHPPVLADRGLADAVRALALDSPARARVTGSLDGRPPAPVESAAYFAVSELLANVAKHAGAQSAEIDLRYSLGRAADQRPRRRRRRRRPRTGHRPARRRAPDRRLRRRARDQQPVRRPYRDHHGDPVRTLVAGHRSPFAPLQRTRLTVRVVIAEDQFLLRDGLIRLLEAYGFEVAAAVDNGDDLLTELRASRPDVAVVDVRLPPTFTDEGLRAALQARRELPGLPVLVLSQYVEQLYARELLADGAGAVGYLLKDRVLDGEQFTDAVKRVADGGTVMDPEVIARLLARTAGAQSPLARLSPREREVLELMAEGRSNAAIAQRLVVTERAIAKHTAAIFTKLDLQPSDDDNRRVLAVLAYLGEQ